MRGIAFPTHSGLTREAHNHHLSCDRRLADPRLRSERDNGFVIDDTTPTAASDAATATLNYWNGINSLPNQIADDMKGGPREQIRALRGAANVIRCNPTLGVDPDLTDWANRLATSLQERADLIEQVRDPSRLADAFLRGARGDPLGPTVELNQAERAWLTNFRNLTREQGQLRARLTTRYGIEFPPP